MTSQRALEYWARGGPKRSPPPLIKACGPMSSGRVFISDETLEEPHIRSVLLATPHETQRLSPVMPLDWAAPLHFLLVSEKVSSQSLSRSTCFAPSGGDMHEVSHLRLSSETCLLSISMRACCQWSTCIQTRSLCVCPLLSQFPCFQLCLFVVSSIFMPRICRSQLLPAPLEMAVIKVLHHQRF